MNANEGPKSAGRRVLLIAAPFAAGAVVAGGVFAGLGITDSSNGSQPGATC